MIDALTPPRWLAISILLGCYAALIALLHDPYYLLAALAPPLLICVAWWTLSGSPDRWLIIFICAAVLLPPLPIALGDSGPHPCLLIAALGLVAGAMRLGAWRMPSGGLSRAIFGLFFVLFASASLAAFYSGPSIAAGTVARVMLFGISVYVFFYVVYGPWRLDSARPLGIARIMFAAGVISAAFACVDFYFQFPAPAGFGPQYVWLMSGMYRRAQGLFYEASTLGNFCAFFLVMIAVALTRPKRDFPVSRAALLSAAAIFFAALVLSFSRASLLNVFVALGALAWLNRSRLRLRKVVWVFALAIVAGIAMTYYLLPSFLTLYWDRLATSATYLFSETEGILSGRLSSWNTLVDFLRENLAYALVGIGYKTLPYTSFLGPSVIGDNMYLTMLVETGLIGLGALIALNISILVNAYRAAKAPRSRGVILRRLDLLFLGGRGVSDDVGRSADLLARDATLFSDAGNRRPRLP